MDQPLNDEVSTTTPQPSPSFNETLNILFGSDAALLAKKSSTLIAKMATYSCHISFLRTCRDHSYTPKGLRLSTPVRSKRASEVLNKASSLLLTERLNYYRQQFARCKQSYDTTIRHLELTLNAEYSQKLLQLNAQKSCFTHRQHLTTHKQKFDKLLLEQNAPFLSPYDQLLNYNIPSPTHRGPLWTTTPTSKSNSSKTVINLSGQHLTPTETEVLSLGLKFVPTPSHDPTPDLAPRIQNVTKQLGDGMEASATYQVCSVLADYDPKRDVTSDNLTHRQRQGLKSLLSKKSSLRFLPADKGNATVVLTNEQYIDKVNTHLSSGAYSKLQRDPTDSLTRKLYTLLKKMKDNNKINNDQFKQMRNLHPRWPQLYGKPKIHKPDAPIRPIVSFYNTPLEALHRVLAHCLKPLAQNPLRLKNSTAFKLHLHSTTHPDYPYHASLDIKSLYTSCDMRAATRTAFTTFQQNPSLLPSNLTAETIGSLINFCLDNSYFEFNGDFYSQDTGGTMGSPLIVELAEIRTAETEQHALSTTTTPPGTYRHFVDDGIGAFANRQHADAFLAYINSLNPDLQYTIEHPSSDGTLPYLDVLIHPDKSTSVYRKPTHTNLYVKYTSCTTNASKNSVIRSLTRRAYDICSPQHLDTELQTVRKICLLNGFPPQRTDSIMTEVRRKFLNTPQLPLANFNRQLRAAEPSLTVSLPFHPTVSKPIKRILQQHDVKVTHSTGTTLQNLLTKTKTTPPPHLTPNSIYETPCTGCSGFYDGQTYRPITKRMEEHERSYRLNNTADELTGQIKSALGHHGRTTGHTIAWNDTQILTSTRLRAQLDLTEHAAIQVRRPAINRIDRVPKCHQLWDPVLPKIAASFKPRQAGINF